MTKAEMKFLIRSGSLQLTKDRKGDGSLESYKYNNKDVFYRTGSSDIHILYEILLKKGHKGEYWVPDNIAPDVIFDIGGNIGIASIYYAIKFPNAMIYTFEPIKENFEILSKNIKEYKNIKAFNIALGNEDGEIEMNLSDCDTNFGGGSMYDIGVNKSKTQKVKIFKPSTIIEKEKIEKIDFIKIDTEGAEYDILSSFDKNILGNVKWIIGELHGINDFKLLDILSKDFDISIKKRINNRLYMFNASNKIFTPKIRKKDIKHINN